MSRRCEAASAALDRHTAEKLKAAFLQLNFRDARHARVIRALDEKCGGFAPATDGEYDIVRQLIAPFAARK